ncbi:MAG: acetoacetate--CoA ligase [Pseudomonadota bacterium]
MSDAGAMPLWVPNEARIANAEVTRFIEWLSGRQSLASADYQGLLHWSIETPDAFWEALVERYQIPIMNRSAVTDGAAMPATRWYPDASLNYMDQVYQNAERSGPAIIAIDDAGHKTEVTWQQMREQAAALAETLRAQGVRPGDRVVAYLPNISEAIIAFHAVARIGAVWSICAPDLGVTGVLDRFAQIEPKCLIACDGYRYGGRDFARDEALTALLDGLPTVEHCVVVPILERPEISARIPVTTWDAATSCRVDSPIENVAFSHPLWIVYSSGTTGKPKAIVHSHGGVVLEHVKQVRLQLDLKPGERFAWFSSTAWMMWNFNIAGLLAGVTVCIIDGHPGKPDLSRLWQIVDALGIHFFGAGAAYFDACRQAGLQPGQTFALETLSAMGSTGSPLSPDGFRWIYDSVKTDIYLSSISGGTDFASACVGGAPTLPVYSGEIACRTLGCAVDAYDGDANALIDEVGELVITKPMPSMPIMFWGDTENRRYKDSYFSMYPGVWQHGDWIAFNERGGAVIYGRSDATINRQGIRMGTADIYQVVEAEPEVVDSLIVDLEYLGKHSYLPLFVVLQTGVSLSDDLIARIKVGIRDQLSPRHVPDDIFVVDDVPRTFSGKKMEIPVRRILLGQTAVADINRDTMSNPESIDWFVRFAAQRRDNDGT